MGDAEEEEEEELLEGEEEELLEGEEEELLEGDDVSAPLALDELEGLLSFPTQNLKQMRLNYKNC